jgi:coniferyl-aldehyde dehydrogenase
MSASPTSHGNTMDIVRADLQATLQLQRAAYLAHPIPSLAERKADLQRA